MFQSNLLHTLLHKHIIMHSILLKNYKFLENKNTRNMLHISGVESVNGWQTLLLKFLVDGAPLFFNASLNRELLEV